MAEEGDPNSPARGSGERFAWLPLALVVGGILTLIVIAAIAGAR